ncbi:hypothetical protein [Paraburkholderia ginsengisoli]|uniref:hypothetical protein n=1 Tax=Paraburkholderia ginsengisoli TaxID=311231 RepID=UPI001E3B8BD3|nr:hypothetical protein [Paraburkholderia ginsengisoli]
MSKSARYSRTASHPPVDALQYEKIALSAFGLIERQISQLDKLVTLAASIYRGPALTHDERSRRRTLLGLLIDTGEDFRRELETDRELYQVIALNAKGIPRSRITARHAANLLAKAATKALEGRKRVRASKAVQIRQARFKTTLAPLPLRIDTTSPRPASDVKKGAINAPFL